MNTVGHPQGSLAGLLVLLGPIATTVAQVWFFHQGAYLLAKKSCVDTVGHSQGFLAGLLVLSGAIATTIAHI